MPSVTIATTVHPAIAQQVFYTILPDSVTRHSFLVAALDSRPSVSRATRDALNHAIQELILVPGSVKSRMHRAPTRLLAAELIKAANQAPALLCLPLQVWQESRPELMAHVQEFLTAENWSDASSTAFMELDDSDRLKTCQEMTERFGRIYPAHLYLESVIGLLIGCSTFAAADQVSEPAITEQKADRPERWPERYHTWSRAIEETPFSSEELDTLPAWVEWLFEQAERQSQAVALEFGRLALESELRQIANLSEAQLAYFELGDARKWTADQCPAAALSSAAERVRQEILEPLAVHQSLQGRATPSLTEARAQRERLAELEQLILSGVANLRNLLGSSAPSSSPDESVLTPVESVALSPAAPIAPEFQGYREVQPPTEIDKPEERPLADLGESLQLEAEINAEAPATPDFVFLKPLTSIDDHTEESPTLPAQASEPSSANAIEDRPFSVQAPLKEIATSLRQRGETEQAGWVELAWALIRDARYGLAYWLTRSFAESRSDLPPTTLIEALAISAVIRNDVSPTALRFLEISGTWAGEPLRGQNGDGRTSFDLLMFAALLRPSLSVPGWVAPALMRLAHLPPGIDELREVVTDYANLGRPIGSTDFGAAQSLVEWKQAYDVLRENTERWHQQAVWFTILYAPATDVWRAWLKPDGWLAKLLDPVITNDAERLEATREDLRRFRTNGEIRQQITATDRRLRSGGAPKISARALTRLQDHAQDALKFVADWVRLLDTRPKVQASLRNVNLHEVRERMALAIDSAHGALSAINAGVINSWAMQTGCAALERSLTAFQRYLNGFEPEGVPEPDLRHLLSLDLLELPSLFLDAEWQPKPGQEAQLRDALLELLAEGRSGWDTAFHAHAAVRNHQATQWILEHLEGTPAGPDVNPLRQLRAKAMDECAAALLRDLDETRIVVENAMVNDILTEADRSQHMSVLDTLAPANVLDFRIPHAQFADIRSEVDRKRVDRAQASRLRMERLPQLSPEDRTRILKALKRGDLSTADEYLVLAEKGQPIEEHLGTYTDLLGEYFPKRLAEIDHDIGATASPAVFIADIAEGRYSRGGLSRLRGAQRNTFVDVLRAWFEIRRFGADAFASRAPEILTRVGILLSWMGIQPSRLEAATTPGRHPWLYLTATLPYGVRIPPDFGSTVSGAYKVLLVWDRPPEAELLQRIADGASNRAALVFYFGRIEAATRRSLAWSMRKSPAGTRPALILDETLLVHLGGCSGSRINALLACTLPFAYVNPYKPLSAGNLPPEMFYGREHEIYTLEDRYGAGFLFGARQVGKSTLLRHIARTYNVPAEGRVAIYIDLKAEGIAEFRATSDLWTILTNAFKAHQLIPTSLQANVTPDTVLKQVQEWIRFDPKRRVLLLLDEADKFLDADVLAKYEHVLRFKNLIQNTDGQFKVVFSGLHSVQRFERDPNQPLAHLGALPLGALEPRVAEALIVEPLQMLGYRFESRDLVIRILSHTNYYPSLIQLFCDELLRHLQRAPFDSRSTPPFTITARHIDDTYRNQNLRDRIRERFEWTLVLDPRYRVIVYVIAHAFLSQSAEGPIGLTADQVASEARRWWPSGFTSISLIDEITGLLKELIGLGVLVGTETDGFRLRSPNVLRLLGNLEQVETQLLEAENTEPPQSFDPHSFRRPLYGPNHPARSVLTATQETDLLQRENGIRLVFGSQAVGLDELAPALEALLSDGVGVLFRPPHRALVTMEAFAKWLREQLDAGSAGRSLIVVPVSSEMNVLRWIQDTQVLLQRRYAAGRHTLVLFAFDALATWQWLSYPEEERSRAEGAGRARVTLQRWDGACLRRWMEDLNIPANTADQRGQILQATGGWPGLLNHFGQKVLEERASWEVALDRVQWDVLRTPFRDEICTSFGVSDLPEVLAVFHTLVEYGDWIDRDGLLSLLENPDLASVERVVQFLDRLGLVMINAQGQVCAEPVAGDLLCRRSADV